MCEWHALLPSDSPRTSFANFIDNTMEIRSASPGLGCNMDLPVFSWTSKDSGEGPMTFALLLVVPVPCVGGGGGLQSDLAFALL